MTRSAHLAAGRYFRLTQLACGLLIAGSALLANQSVRQPLAVESRLVLVNATVVDEQNRVRTDLQAKDFRLFEDGRPVDISSVSLEDVPLSTIILFDVSGSMKGRIEFARAALDVFLARTREGDEYCLVLFSDRVEPQCEFNSDVQSVRQKAILATPAGDTAVIDALVFGLNRIKSATNARRAILVISDADDTRSRYRWKDARRQALESTAAVYAISPPVWDETGQLDSHELQRIVEETGGRFLLARKQRLMATYMERLDIRLQYVISYVPGEPVQSGLFHQIKLQLRGNNRKGQRAYWRRGYYTPSGN